MSAPTQRPKGAATIKLVGNAVNVVGNQVDSGSPIPAVDFGGASGLYIGNMAAGSFANLGSPPPDRRVKSVVEAS